MKPNGTAEILQQTRDKRQEKTILCDSEKNLSGTKAKHMHINKIEKKGIC